MVKRRSDGTLRIVASIRDNNWMKPQDDPFRNAVSDFFDKHDRTPTAEEREEIRRSLVTGDSKAT